MGNLNLFTQLFLIILMVGIIGDIILNLIRIKLKLEIKKLNLEIKDHTKQIGNAVVKEEFKIIPIKINIIDDPVGNTLSGANINVIEDEVRKKLLQEIVDLGLIETDIINEEGTTFTQYIAKIYVCKKLN